MKIKKRNKNLVSSEMGTLHKIEILRWGEASDNPIYYGSFIFFIRIYFSPDKYVHVL